MARFMASGPPSPPIHREGLEIAADRRADGREERFFAEPRQEPESLQLVLDGVFHLGEADSMPAACRVSSSSASDIRGSHVDAGDRFRRHDHPAHRRGRCATAPARDPEQLGVGEEQGRIQRKAPGRGSGGHRDNA